MHGLYHAAGSTKQPFAKPFASSNISVIALVVSYNAGCLLTPALPPYILPQGCGFLQDPRNDKGRSQAPSPSSCCAGSAGVNVLWTCDRLTSPPLARPRLRAFIRAPLQMIVGSRRGVSPCLCLFLTFLVVMTILSRVVLSAGRRHQVAAFGTLLSSSAPRSQRHAPSSRSSSSSAALPYTRRPPSPFAPATRPYASTTTTTPPTSTTTEPARIKVRDILIKGDDSLLGKKVTIKGWVRTLRSQKAFSFIEVNDGSTLGGLQIVADAEKVPGYEAAIAGIHTGAAIGVVGTIKESPGKGQKYEIAAESVDVIGGCDPETYPLQKKRHTLEFLRGIAHLRPRTNTLAAVSRVRSSLAFATHKFFQEQGFYYLQSPIITASDCEGAGEMFRVTTLSDKVSKIPRKKEDSDAIDYTQDFFGAPAFLTVSGQLSGEAYACALGDVYTFGPTFRAENSQTTRHLAEFNMIEPEMAFADLRDNMANAEAYVKAIVGHVLKECGEDLAFFEKFYDKTLVGRLTTVRWGEGWREGG